MSYTGRIVTVTAHYSEPPYLDADGRRWQGHRWVAATENGRELARSSENYTNRTDAEDAAELLFKRILRAGKRGTKVCRKCKRQGQKQFQLDEDGHWVCRSQISCLMRALPYAGGAVNGPTIREGAVIVLAALVVAVAVAVCSEFGALLWSWVDDLRATEVPSRCQLVIV